MSEKCSFYSDDRTPVNRTACSTHGDRHPITCADEWSQKYDAALASLDQQNDYKALVETLKGEVSKQRLAYDMLGRAHAKALKVVEAARAAVVWRPHHLGDIIEGLDSALKEFDEVKHG